jgi:two-component system, LytTR family, response regulator
VNKIKAIIIDDDEFIHYHLQQKLLQICPEVEIVALCENAVHGLESINRLEPDLIFLDIQMPEISGFDLLQQLGAYNFSVVFITSFNQYAIEAIRYSALDYLLKPIKDEELLGAIARFKQRQSPQSLQIQMDNLLHNLSKTNAEFKIVIATRNGEKSLPIHQIIRCEGDSNYTHLHLSDQSRLTASKTLKDFEDMLPESDFLRVHKSHLVNKNFVVSMSQDGQLLLKNNQKIEVAKRRIALVRQLLPN